MNLKPFYQDVLSWNDFAGNNINNKKLIELYEDLVREESKEIFDSLKDNDAVEFIDGVSDSLVVGSFLKALIYDENYENHSTSTEKGDLNQLISKLETLLVDPKGNINEIILILEIMSNSVEVNLVDCCEEVMISNWSKFPLITDVNPENETTFIENQGRYSGIVFEIKLDSSNEKRYIFKNNKGKIVKPSTFQEPRLKDFLSESFLNLNIFK
jgi:hypothetical protein